MFKQQYHKPINVNIQECCLIDDIIKPNNKNENIDMVKYITNINDVKCIWFINYTMKKNPKISIIYDNHIYHFKSAQLKTKCITLYGVCYYFHDSKIQNAILYGEMRQPNTCYTRICVNYKLTSIINNNDMPNDINCESMIPLIHKYNFEIQLSKTIKCTYQHAYDIIFFKLAFTETLFIYNNNDFKGTSAGNIYTQIILFKYIKYIKYHNNNCKLFTQYQPHTINVFKLPTLFKIKTIVYKLPKRLKTIKLNDIYNEYINKNENLFNMNRLWQNISMYVNNKINEYNINNPIETFIHTDKRSVAFISKDGAKRFMDIDLKMIDGTFKIVPYIKGNRFHLQYIIIIAVIFNDDNTKTNSFYIASGLLQNRDNTIYNWFLTCIIKYYKKLYKNKINTQTHIIKTDGEQAIIKAIHDTCKQQQIKLNQMYCNFHIIHDLMKWAKKNGFNPFISQKNKTNATKLFEKPKQKITKQNKTNNYDHAILLYIILDIYCLTFTPPLLSKYIFENYITIEIHTYIIENYKNDTKLKNTILKLITNLNKYVTDNIHKYFIDIKSNHMCLSNNTLEKTHDWMYQQHNTKPSIITFTQQIIHLEITAYHKYYLYTQKKLTLKPRSQKLITLNNKLSEKQQILLNIPQNEFEAKKQLIFDTFNDIKNVLNEYRKYKKKYTNKSNTIYMGKRIAFTVNTNNEWLFGNIININTKKINIKLDKPFLNKLTFIIPINEHNEPAHQYLIKPYPINFTKTAFIKNNTMYTTINQIKSAITNNKNRININIDNTWFSGNIKTQKQSINIIFDDKDTMHISLKKLKEYEFRIDTDTVIIKNPENTQYPSNYDHLN